MNADKRSRLEQKVFPLLRCVRCSTGALDLSADRIVCRGCSQAYPVHGNIPLMTLEPDQALTYSKEVVVENIYSSQWTDLVAKAGTKPVLDLGSGNNPMTFDHVVKMDVFALPNADVVGLGEALPFRDGVFHTVFSGAVFEHLKDPFRAIKEVGRVLQPRGEVYIETAFLQPVHAFPDHYFNMTLRGLERLCTGFERLDSGVMPHQAPSFMLRWVLQVWAAKLGEEERKDFLAATVADILGEYSKDVFSKRWMQHFTRRDLEELAAGVYFHGYKREESGDRRGDPEGG